MKRALAAVLTATAALGMTAVGVAPASAADDPYPKSEGWSKFDNRGVMPAGFACKAKIRTHAYGHSRFFQISKREGFVDYGEDARATFTNPANGKKVKVDISGDGLFRDSKDGRTVRITAFGGSVWQGKGIKGIVYADGVQKVKITNAGSKKETQHLTIVNGTRKELCKKLGTRPVKGKNIQPEDLRATPTG